MGSFVLRDVSDSARNVGERCANVLSSLNAIARGTHALENAANTVSGILGDLDTTIMFATAGTLNADADDEVFADHRENILKTAKALVEDTKTLVAGAASSQEQLAVAAQNAVSTIVQLSDVVKNGAASLGSQNQEAQGMLINAVKDVTSALGDLMQATKSASGKNMQHPAMHQLKDTAKDPETDWLQSDLEDELVNLKDEEQFADHPTQDILNLLPLVQCNSSSYISKQLDFLL